MICDPEVRLEVRSKLDRIDDLEDLVHEGPVFDVDQLQVSDVVHDLEKLEEHSQ